MHLHRIHLNDELVVQLPFPSQVAAQQWVQHIPDDARMHLSQFRVVVPGEKPVRLPFPNTHLAQLWAELCYPTAHPASVLREEAQL